MTTNVFDGKQLFGKKYRVDSETSKLIQEAVIAAGGGWRRGREKKVLFLYSNFLWVSSDGDLCKEDVDETFFLEDETPEGVVTIGITGVTVVDKELEAKKKQLEELDAKIKELQAIADNLKKEM